MKLLRVIIALMLILLPPSRLFAESLEELQNFSKNVKFYTLSNGIRVILYRRGVAPIFAGAVSIRVGGSDETLGITGISHMLEHMAFKGTPSIGTTDYHLETKLLLELEELAKQTDFGNNFTKEQKERWQILRTRLGELWGNGESFSREYEKRGAVGMNATTSTDLTQYFVSLPRPSFEFWCWLESERLINPVMRQFYEERDVVLEERRTRYEDNPVNKLYETLLGTAFLVHPYRNPVIGHEFDIRQLTATKIAEFHKKYYVPANIVVSVVGDIDPENDLKIIEKYFGKVKTDKLPDRPTLEEPEQQGERRISLLSHVAPQILIAYRKVQYPHPDDAALSILFETLAKGRVSPLYLELVKKNRIATQIGYFEAPGIAYPNLVVFSGVPRQPHRNDELLTAFDKVLNEFKKVGPSEEQLQMAKNSLIVDYLNTLKSNMSLATELASSELLFGSWDSLIDWYDQIMKVNKADVLRVAQTYLQPQYRTIGAVERQEQ